MHSVLQYLLNAGCISGTVLSTEETRHFLDLMDLMCATRPEGSTGDSGSLRRNKWPAGLGFGTEG